MNRCSRCQETWYCSVEHQKQDWKVHKSTVCFADDPRVLKLVKAISNNETLIVEELALINAVLNGKVTYHPPEESRPLRKWTPLHECARSGNLDLARILLKYDPKLEVKDGDGETPLFIAANARAPDVTRALLDAGANPNAKGNDGWSALMMATRNSDIETIQALFDSYVDVFVGCVMIGRNALDMAHTLATGQAIGVRQGETFEEVLQKAQRIVPMYEEYLDALQNKKSDLA